MSRIFKHTPSIAVVSIASLALVSFNASAAVAATPAPDIFSVTTLTTSNPVFVDSNSATSDDDGFVGVTGTKFLTTGDFATVAYDLADMGNAYVTNLTNDATDQNNWLFSDLKTQTSYVFENAENTAVGTEAYDITGIQPLNQTGDIEGAVVPLSATVTIDNSLNDCTIFAGGYGRVAIWDGCLGVIYDIALPSGAVATITGATTFANYDATNPINSDYYETENGVSQAGIVEFDGTALHFIAVAYNSARNDLEGIFRYDVQNAGAAPTELLAFGESIDMYQLTASPATGQWCSHVEGGWSAISPGSESELAFCATATFAVPAAVVPAAAPGLAATGVDASLPLALGGLVLVLGFGLILVARRRRAA